MNSYNENLTAAVQATLQNQQLNLKMLKSEENASLFTLYYARGALITAGNELKTAKDQFKLSSAVKQQAVHCGSLSQNLLASANLGNQYIKQSVTNAAVAAANVQIAANSIVKLAGDISSIFSIIAAADFESDMYKLIKEIKACIDETASDAQMASQTAMEASVLTTEVSTATVLDKAKNNHKAINNLLKQVRDEYDIAVQQVAFDKAKLESDIVEEKQAEGNYYGINIIAAAAKNACKLANRELNLGLKAVQVKALNNTSFSVEFYLLNSPFLQKETEAFYPVKDYYLFVVKDKQQSAFSIANAEAILNNNADVKRYIILNGLMNHAVSKNGENKFIQTFNSQIISLPGKATYGLQDTDGNEIETGVDYVVFIHAVYQDSYKKRLNDFDDFLSAPSAEFRLVNQLAIVCFNQPMERSMLKDSTATVNGGESIFFTVTEYPGFNVAYRCIFLPVSKFDFDFNLALAQQVGAGNYTSVSGPGKSFVNPGNGTALSEWEVKINEDTTDCFGNVLISGHDYIPVILSVTTIKEPELTKYKNTCTDFKQTCFFTYKRHK